MNVFKQFKIAVFDIKRYSELIHLKMGSFIAYIFILIFINILGLVVTLLPMYVQVGGISGLLQDYIPEFYVRDGKLCMEKVDYTDDMRSVRIYIDTDSNDMETAKGRGYKTVLIASEKEAYISNGVNSCTIEMADLEGFSKKAVVEFCSNWSIISVIAFSFLLTGIIIFGVSLLANCAVNACIAALANAVSMRAKLSFRQIFRICVYAYTLPIVLNCLITFFGIYLLQALPMVVAFVYIYLAIKEIKNNDGIVVAFLE